MSSRYFLNIARGSPRHPAHFSKPMSENGNERDPVRADDCDRHLPAPCSQARSLRHHYRRNPIGRPKGPSAPTAKTTCRFDITRKIVGGCDVYSVRAKRSAWSFQGTVIYLHGGAFVGEILPNYWTFIADIASRSGARSSCRSTDSLPIIMSTRVPSTRRPSPQARAHRADQHSG